MEKTCKYINKDGVRCKSTAFKRDKDSPYYGYCFGHATMLGLVPEDEKKARILKISKTKKEISQKKQHTKGLLSGGNVSKERVSDKKNKLIEKATKIYEDMMGFSDFELKDMTNEALNAGGNLEIESKNLFLLWWMADAATRSPQKISDVAKIIGRTVYELKSWLTESWFLKKINEHRKIIHKLMSPMVDKINIVQAMVGDSKAKEIFYKQIISSDDIAEDDIFGDVDDALLSEARELSGVNNNPTGVLKSSEEEKKLARSVSELMNVTDRLNRNRE